MTVVKEMFGKALFLTGKSRVGLIDQIAAMNRVSRNTVYSWFRKLDDASYRGRLEATLEQILLEHSKGDK